jgi:hypothetical protein
MVYPYDEGDLNPETHLSFNKERAVRRFFWFEFEADIELNDATEIIQGVAEQDFNSPFFTQAPAAGGLGTTFTFEHPGDVVRDHAYRRLVMCIFNADPEFGTIYKGELDDKPA